MIKNTAAADRIKKRVANYYRRKKRVCYYELGLNKGGKLRADVFVLAMSGHIVVVEVKSSVADFKSFPDKAPLYSNYCNQLYLAVEKPLYAKIKDRIPQGVGVFVFDPEDGRTKPRVIRAKNSALPEDVQKNLFIRAAFRNADTSNRKNKRASS
jgi:hypothetical protein